MRGFERGGLYGLDGDAMKFLIILIALVQVFIGGYQLAEKKWIDGLVSFGIGVILLLAVYVFERLFGGAGGNDGPVSVPTTDGKNVIVSGSPGHSESNAARAAELVNQRLFGRNRGEQKEVYVSYHPGDQNAHHTENRYVEWLTKVTPGHSMTNAEEADVIVHIVSEEERDARTEGWYRE